jgi:hypothetical protein
MLTFLYVQNINDCTEDYKNMLLWLWWQNTVSSVDVNILNVFRLVFFLMNTLLLSITCSLYVWFEHLSNAIHSFIMMNNKLVISFFLFHWTQAAEFIIRMFALELLSMISHYFLVSSNFF